MTNDLEQAFKIRANDYALGKGRSEQWKFILILSLGLEVIDQKRVVLRFRNRYLF